MSLKFYCVSCGEFQETIIEPMVRETTFPWHNIWGHIICKKCNLAFHTVKVDEEGIYDFVKIAELPKES